MATHQAMSGRNPKRQATFALSSVTGLILPGGLDMMGAHPGPWPMVPLAPWDTTDPDVVDDAPDPHGKLGPAVPGGDVAAFHPELGVDNLLHQFLSDKRCYVRFNQIDRQVYNTCIVILMRLKLTNSLLTKSKHVKGLGMCQKLRRHPRPSS